MTGFNNAYRYDTIQVNNGSTSFLIGTGTMTSFGTILYLYNGSTFNQQVTPFRTSPSVGLKCFKIQTSSYVAIGRLGDTDIYQWNGTSWIQFQSLVAVYTPIIIRTFEDANNNTYLITLESDLEENNPPTGNLYKWSGTQFGTPIQSFSLYGTDIEIFTIDTTIYMVISAFTLSVQSQSIVYRWNNNLEVFDSISILVNSENFGIGSLTSTNLFGTEYLFGGYQYSSSSFIYQLI